MAATEIHGIRHLVTDNRDDFSPYPYVEAFSPTAALAAVRLLIDGP